MQIPAKFPKYVSFVCLGMENLAEAKLHPEEAKLLSDRALEKRRNEFRLGRWAARSALQGLGISDPPPIVRGLHRAPVWPDGIQGSITHCGDHAAVAVARSERVRGLGIDLERMNRKSSIDISSKIASEKELKWVDSSEEKLMMIFSAKEALFKALYPLYLDYFWHHQAELTWDEKSESFSATLDFAPSQDLPPGTQFTIQVVNFTGHIFSFMILEA